MIQGTKLAPGAKAFGESHERRTVTAETAERARRRLVRRRAIVAAPTHPPPVTAGGGMDAIVMMAWKYEYSL